MSDLTKSARILELSRTLRSTIAELQILASSPDDAYPEAVKLIQSSVLPLRDLTFRLLPPTIAWREYMWTLSELHPLRFALHFKLAHHIPLDGAATLIELSQKTGVPQEYLGRMMRLLVTIGVFERAGRGKEGGEEGWKHNAMSQGLREEGTEGILEIS